MFHVKHRGVRMTIDGENFGFIMITLIAVILLCYLIAIDK